MPLPSKQQVLQFKGLKRNGFCSLEFEIKHLRINGSEIPQRYHLSCDFTNFLFLNESRGLKNEQITHFVNNRKLFYLHQNHLNRFGQFFSKNIFSHQYLLNLKKCVQLQLQLSFRNIQRSKVYFRSMLPKSVLAKQRKQ